MRGTERFQRDLMHQQDKLTRKLSKAEEAAAQAKHEAVRRGRRCSELEQAIGWCRQRIEFLEKQLTQESGRTHPEAESE